MPESTLIQSQNRLRDLDLASGEALQIGKHLLVSLPSQLPWTVNLDLRPILNAHNYLVGHC